MHVTNDIYFQYRGKSYLFLNAFPISSFVSLIIFYSVISVTQKARNVIFLN